MNAAASLLLPQSFRLNFFHFSMISLPPPPPPPPLIINESQISINYGAQGRGRGRRSGMGLVASSSSPPSTAQSDQKPLIELDFFGVKAEGDGSSNAVERASAASGEKLLRNIMLDNKIELYATYGKVMNCGGGGSCGTCLVEIIDGKELLNERTDAEKRYLKNKPESWRLACQTIVGNKENSGKVAVQRLPQWKK